MVAIITAKGAGIESGSVSLLGSGGQVGGAALGRSGENAYVDAASGNLLLTTVDEVLLGRGPDAVASRTYNSLGAWDGDNDDYWRASAYRRVYNQTGTYGASGSTITRTDWDGTETVYTWNGSYTDGTTTGFYVATDGAGAYDTLIKSGSTWTWKDGDTQVAESYDASNSGRITARTDPEGNAVTYTYSSGLLTRVSTNGGTEYTNLVYSGTNLVSLETHTTSPTATTTRIFYEYDGSNRLVTVKVNLDPTDNSSSTGSNYTTSYTYDSSSKRIASISQSDGTAISFGYTSVGGAYRVTSIVQTIATGITRTTTLSYDTTNRVTTVADELGQTTRLAYDASGNLLTLTLPPTGTNDPAPVMSYTYESDGDVATMTAAGNTITYDYDSHGNRTLERDSLGNTVTRTFSARNELLTETRYTVPDPDGAGSGTPSGAMTTSYVYNALGNMRYRLAPDGGVTEYRYDGFGQLISTIDYTGTLYASTITEAALDTWVAAMTDRSAAQRTDTTYDFRGNVASTVSYAILSAFGEGTTPPATITAGTRTTVTAQSDGLYRITKTSTTGTDDWNADAHSTIRAEGDFVLQLRTVQTGKFTLGGVATAPASSASYTNPNYGFYFNSTGGVNYMESGTYASLGVTYAAGDSFWLVRSGSTVTYYKGATLSAAMTAGALRTVTGVTSTLYFDSSIYSAGASLDAGFTPQPAGTTADSNDRSRTTYVYSSHGELLSKVVDGTGTTETHVYDGLGRITSKTELAPSANLLTDATSSTPWTLTNATLPSTTAINGINAWLLDVTTGGTTSSAATWGQQISVSNGDTATFTITLMAGTASTSVVSMLGGISSVGDGADSSIEILTGPGSVSRQGGAAFNVTGLSTSTATTVKITRTFRTNENFVVRVNVTTGTTPAATDNLVISNPIVTSSIGPRTSFAYSDTSDGSTVTVTLDNGLARVSTYDKAGDLVSYAESGTGVTTAITNYVYDRLGRLRVAGEPTISSTPSITETNRRRNYVFYDAEGRKIADIDADGTAIEYRYDAAGRIISSTTYATLVGTSALTPGSTGIIDASGNLRDVSFASLRPSTNASDRWTWSFYDTTGRKIRDIDGTGSVTAYSYDGASQLVSTAEYANRMTSGDLAALKAAAIGANLLTDSTSSAPWSLTNATLPSTTAINGINAYLLDVTTGGTTSSAATWGQQIAMVDGDTATFTITLMAGTASSSIVSMLGSLSSVGNAADSSIEILSGPGSVSRQAGAGFNVTGLSTSTATTIRLTRTFTQTETLIVRVNVTTGSTPAATDNLVISNPIVSRAPTLPALPTADSTNDRISRLFYDNAGRMIGTLDAEGYLTETIYDAAGRKVRSIAYSGTTSTTYRASGTFAQLKGSITTDDSKDIRAWWLYDARGLLRATIDGEGTLTRFDYSPAGYLTQQTSGQKLSVTTLIATAPTLAGLPAPGGSEILSVTAWTTNAWGQKLTEVTTLTGSTTTTTTYTYDTMRNLVSTVTQSGGVDPRTYSQRYDKQGRVTSELSGDGNVALAALGGSPSQSAIDGVYTNYGWTNVYDAAGRLVSRTGPKGVAAAGPKTLYYYNADGALIYEIDAAGRTIEYRYNAFGERTDTIVYANPITDLSTMAGGTDVSLVTARLTAASAADTATHADFNVDGTLSQSRDALSSTATYAYNAFGELITETDPFGASTTIQTSRTYDRRGLLKTEVVDSASGGKAITTSYGYDAFGRAITLTNALSKVTSSAYDRKGRLASTTDALSHTTSYTYDARDNLVAVTDALGKVTRYVYDKANRKIATIDALGGLTTTTYDADGRVIATRAYLNTVSLTGLATEVAETNTTLTTALANTNAADHVSRYAYDKDGQLRFTMDGLGHVVEQVNDAQGNVIRTIAYDGTVTATPSGGNYSESWFAGQVAGLTLSSNRVTRSVYDATNRLNYTIDALGQVCRYVYDARGLLTKKVEFASTTSVPTGDPLVGAMDTWQGTYANANDRTTRAVYDKKGQLAYSIDALGYVTRSQYDKLGNVVKQSRYADAYTFVEGTTTLAILDSYYATPPSTARITQFAYDSAGRLTDTTDPEGFVTHLALDAMGQITSSTDADGSADSRKTLFTYDDVGRMLTSTVQMGASPSGADLVTARSYDAAGNLLSSVTASSTDAATTAYTYDDAGRLLSETRQMASGGDLVTSYTYDVFGNVAKVHDARGNDTYAYFDVLGRQVASRDAEDFVTSTSYTTFGEIASVTRHSAHVTNSAAVGTPPTWTWYGTDVPAATPFEYDKLGRLTKSTDAEGYYEQYTLDRFGNRTSVRNKLGGVTNYTYDKRGLVLSETLPTPVTTKNSSGTTIAVVNSFDYDAFGDRIQMIEAVGAADEQRTTSYEYDKLGRLIQTSGTAVTVYSDTLTSHALTSSSVAAVVQVTYDARGNVIKTVGAGAATWSFYDLADRKIAELSPVGTLTTYGYDKRGNVTSTRVYDAVVSAPTSPGGAPPTSGASYRETTYAYDNANRLTSTSVAGLASGEWNGSAYSTTSSGTIATYLEYDAAGNVLRQIDGRGNLVRSYYDKLGRKIAQVDQERYLTVWDRDAEGNATRETRYATALPSSGGGAVDIETATLAAMQTAGGTTGNRVTEFTYDLVGNRKTEKRKDVLARTLQSNGNLDDDPTSLEDATIAYTYNGLGQVLTKIEANGDTTHYTYDTDGRLTLEERASFQSYLWTTGGNDATPRTAYTYDGLNNLKSSRVQKGATAVDADDRITTYTYDHAGRLASMTDATGFTHNYGYDLAGRQVLDSYTRTRSDNSTVEEAVYTRYDAAGRAIVQTNARKNSGGAWVFTVSDTTGAPQFDATRTAYNAYGEVSGRGRTAGWDGVTAVYQESFEYDAGGRLWSSNTGDGVKRYFLYDKAGNQTLAIAPSSATSALSYAAPSNLISALAGGTPSGTVTTITVYDKRGQVVATRQPDRQLTGSGTSTITDSRTYNAFGEVTAQTDARGYTTSFTYNSMGRMLSKVSPEVSILPPSGSATTTHPTETYFYDVSGRLIATTDANGNTSRRALLAGTGHDGTEALVTREYHPGTGTSGGMFETRYDVFGDARILRNELYSSVTDNHVATDQVQAFDKLGRLTAVQHRGALLTDSYRYDGLGQRTRHWNDFPALSGDIETTDYDAQGRVVATRTFGGDTTAIVYAWNASLETGGMATSTAAFGGWTATTTYVNSRTSIESTDYFGRTVAQTDMGANSTSFTYDLAGRMTARAIGAQTDSYTWYNSGLIATLTSTVSGVATVLTSTYDAAGNKLSEYQTIAGTVIENATASYDALNRLVTWTEAGNTTTYAATTTYSYDAASNVRGTATTFRYLNWDGSFESYNSTEGGAYTYDSMNRMVSARGTVITYDAAGRRATVTTPANVPYDGYRATEPGSGFIYYSDEPTDWDGYNWVPAGASTTFAGHAIESYTYTADGQLASVSVATEIGTASGTLSISQTGTYNAPVLRAAYTYDEMGRALTQTEYTRYGAAAYSRTVTYNAKGQVTGDTVTSVQGGHSFTTVTANSYGTGTGYALGAIVSSTGDTSRDGTDGDVPDTSTVNTLVWHDGAVVSSIAYTSDVSHPLVVWDTAYTLRPTGVVAAAAIDAGRDHDVAFKLDAFGQAIRRDESHSYDSTGDPHEIWYRFNGREMGHVGNDGTYDTDYAASIADRGAVTSSDAGAFRHEFSTGSKTAMFGEAYVPFTSFAQGESGGSYTVQAGDARASNTAPTFKPYDPPA